MIRFFRALWCAALSTAGPLAQRPVPVVRPERTELVREAKLPGTVIPDERLELEARVTGYLAEIPVDYGSVVSKGDLLARLAVPDLEAEIHRARMAERQAEAAIGDAEAAVEVAQAGIEKARAAVEVCEAEVRLKDVLARRTRSLFEHNSATRKELDQADGALAMAKARCRAAAAEVLVAETTKKAAEKALESARALLGLRRAEVARLVTELGFATLRCPFERAVVTARRIDRGALVRKETTRILSLARVDRVRVEIEVPERDAVFVGPGTPIDLRLDARPSELIHAAVSRTSRSLTRSRVLRVQIDLDNPDDRLLPGMFLYARLHLTKGKPVLTVPARALHTPADGSPFVFVAEGGRARRIEVRTGPQVGARVAILGGLTGKEFVILAGDFHDGEPIRAVPAGAGR